MFTQEQKLKEIDPSESLLEKGAQEVAEPKKKTTKKKKTIEEE